jgi:hypothetical protein
MMLLSGIRIPTVIILAASKLIRDRSLIVLASRVVKSSRLIYSIEPSVLYAKRGVVGSR